MFGLSTHFSPNYEPVRERHTDGQTDVQDPSCGLLGWLPK